MLGLLCPTKTMKLKMKIFIINDVVNINDVANITDVANINDDPSMSSFL